LKYHDKNVATGTLDANGGATIVVTAVMKKATVVLADADDRSETIEEDKDGNPTGASLPHVLIELRSQDGEDEFGTRFRFEGALSSALTIPIPSGTLRLRIRIFGADGQPSLDVKGPITASTSGSAASPCPSTAPTASPSASPSDSPSAEPSPSPSASAPASASPTASASPGPQ